MAPRASLLLATLALAACVAVSAHSWLDCADWRFNDAGANSEPSLRRWSDADGKCYAHARKYEVGIKPFGKMDEVQFFRHYVQKFTTGALACRNNGATSSDSGSSEGTQASRASSYAPNTNAYGQVYGDMAKVYSGQQLCWRWPAKNHFAHVNVATNPLFVNWDDVPNRSAPSLTQEQMDSKRLTAVSMLWANCPVPGPASNGDSTGVGSELRPCGGCFTVPERAPGIYTVQWEWPFKDANSETYTSCADIEVLGSTSSLTPVDCVVSAWGAWGTCSGDCGAGTQTRTRTVTTARVGTGAACPTLVGTQQCNTQPCTNYISEHVVYDDTLHGFSDWSWSTSYSLASTAVTRGASATSISWSPNNWQAVYLHYDIGAVSVADYQSISFWIHGGTTGGQQITFSLVVTGQSSSPVLTYAVPTSKIVAGVWNKVDLNFANLGMTTGNFDGIWWQANSASQQGVLYIDDVYFMHVHQGGAQPVVTEDLCASVTCPTNSACSGGVCTCTGGYSGTTCTIAPSITSVSVKSLAGLAVTSINGDDLLTITWTSVGTLPSVSIVLLGNDSAIPLPLATQINNAGTFSWTVPSTLAAGSYTVRVLYSSLVYGSSSALTKAGTAVASSCAVCTVHGICDEDTAPLCVCRYGYTGPTCAVAPSGVSKLRVAIIVGIPVTTYASAPDRFAQVFRSDLASALRLTTDQIELVSVERHTALTSLVTFDLLSGGSFTASPLAITSSATYSAALTSQLEQPDSNINRATYSYALTTDANEAPRLQSSMVATAAIVLAAAAAALV